MECPLRMARSRFPEIELMTRLPARHPLGLPVYVPRLPPAPLSMLENFPTSTMEPAGAEGHRRAAREGDEPGGESSIRSPETATAPFSMGTPSIVTTERARTIIPLLQLSGMRPPKDCTVPGKEAEL